MVSILVPRAGFLSNGKESARSRGRFFEQLKVQTLQCSSFSNPNSSLNAQLLLNFFLGHTCLQSQEVSKIYLFRISLKCFNLCLKNSIPAVSELLTV